MTRCARCDSAAKRLVVYISRRTRREHSRVALCDRHIQNELMLGASNLSMVDVELKDLPAEP